MLFAAHRLVPHKFLWLVCSPRLQFGLKSLNMDMELESVRHSFSFAAPTTEELVNLSSSPPLRISFDSPLEPLLFPASDLPETFPPLEEISSSPEVLSSSPAELAWGTASTLDFSSEDCPFDSQFDAVTGTEGDTVARPVKEPTSQPTSEVSLSGETSAQLCLPGVKSSPTKGDAVRKGSRCRKRKRDPLTEPLETSVTLPKDVLLSISSKEFSAYADQCRKERKLSQEEIKDLRRQKRLVKNRESAQASRTRRKALLEEMKFKIADLTETNNKMNEKLAALEAENNSLKSEVAELTNIVSRAGAKLSNILNSYSGKPSNMTAGVCLMVILFSFGMFFQPHNAPSLLESSSVSHTHIPRLRGHGRKLLSFDDSRSSNSNSGLESRMRPVSLGRDDKVHPYTNRQANTTLVLCQGFEGVAESADSAALVFLVAPERLAQALQQQELAGNNNFLGLPFHLLQQQLPLSPVLAQST